MPTRPALFMYDHRGRELSVGVHENDKSYFRIAHSVPPVWPPMADPSYSCRGRALVPVTKCENS